MKAIVIIDIDEKYIGAIGTEIQFVNRKYNCKWELKPIPKKESEKHREEIGDWTGLAYSQGWNACIDKITGETE